MKTFNYSVGLFCALAVGLFIVSCKQAPDAELNTKEFENPPLSSSIHAWWHWLDNSITKEGITKDLEAMKKQGISLPPF